MCASLATWYTSQYSNWNRTRRLQQTPYLARTETNTSRQARAMAATTQAPDGLGNNNLVGPPPALTKDNQKEKKGPETLFGPNIGAISGGPAWTNSNEKKVVKEELTMDVVKSWIEKSKEPSQPTTTLQALVNLKRPTIRLSPLQSSEEDGPHHALHAIEFEYDCDAPKCGIYVNVFLPAGHPDATPAAESAPSKHSKLLVFETVVDGGFGKKLKVEEGAVLELGRYTNTNANPSETPETTAGPSSTPPPATPAATTPANNQNSRRKRLTHMFTKRHNSRNLSVSGPALAVVDASSADNPAPANESEIKSRKSGEGDDGVKVTIRLAALDEHSRELDCVNEQVTYLSVERFGVKTVKSSVALRSTTPSTSAPAAGAEDSAEEAKPSEEAEVKSHSQEEDEEVDNRPWVVKVVKREATIGPHTFHLHEIYGLTSSSSSAHTNAPTAALPSTHTYPPVADATGTSADAGNDDSPSECLLCLSSPREVVLLPCRHLVACKDCALNMVEFGAGGNITQATEDSGAAGEAGADGTNGGNDAEGAAANAAPTPAAPASPIATRRKRKAKGWFCPVCRQPYTSLLRITTNPPVLPNSTDKPDDEDARPSADSDEEVVVVDADPDEEPNVDGDAPGLPLPVTAQTGSNTNPPTTPSSVRAPSVHSTAEAGSGAGGIIPGFLRGITGRANNNNNNSANGSRGDLENQL